ncbi:MAG: hypothetical protein IT466_06370 [Moraxellaceae bacterium]|nr:hypothetical protein [Moraxellaceae bacterium]
MRDKYLSDPDVQGFIEYLAKVIKGSVPINIKVGFSRNKLPEDFESQFPGGEVNGRGAAAVYEVEIDTLKSLFHMYWWNRQYYEFNEKILLSVSADIEKSIAGESTSEGHALAMNACHEVMKWGFGEGTRAYRANMNWAGELGDQLIPTLRLGRDTLSSDTPNFDVFGRGDGNAAHLPRTPKMNAGWTKYYALALSHFIIYDGRVGAALGLLVRRYLESLPDTTRPDQLPASLAFPWASGRGSNQRNPSSAIYTFPRLRHTNAGAREWAKVNVQANWVLAEAQKLSQASWLPADDGLRRLEASLFMLGYDFSRFQ